MDKDTKVLLRITFRTELRPQITKLLKTPQITQITCLFLPIYRTRSSHIYLSQFSTDLDQNVHAPPLGQT